MSKLSRNLRKKLSAGLAVIMAVSLAIPAGVSFSSQTVKAEGLTSETKDVTLFMISEMVLSFLPIQTVNLTLLMEI